MINTLCCGICIAMQWGMTFAHIAFMHIWHITPCFKCLELNCGICIAMQWGMTFAHIAFMHIWHITPCFKCLELNCGCCQKLYGMCVHCCLDPICEAIALCF